MNTRIQYRLACKKRMVLFLMAVIFSAVQNNLFAADRLPGAITDFSGGGTYCENDAAIPLSVTFDTCKFGSGQQQNYPITVTWYSNTTNATTGGLQVHQVNSNTGTTTFTYTPLTNTVGTLFYYVEISWAGGIVCDRNGGPSPLSTGTFTPSTQAVIVNPAQPNTPGPISGPTSVNPGTSNLVYSIDAVADADTYTWNVPVGWSIQSGQGTISISATSSSTSGNISVTASNSCGTSAAQSLLVNVTAANSPPVVNVPTTQSICEDETYILGNPPDIEDLDGDNQGVIITVTNGTLDLVNSGVTINNDGTGNVSITNDANATLTNINNAFNGAIFTPSITSGTASIQIEANDGTDSGSNSFDIIVYPLPIALDISGANEVCTGSTIDLTEGTAGTISWFSSAPGVATIDGNGLVTPVSAGTTNITYTVTNGNGCTSLPSSAHVVTVHAQPATANAGTNQSICTSETATLGANNPSVGSASWSIVAGSPSSNLSQFSSLTDPSALFTPDGGIGDYVLRWTISNGSCTASTSDVTITVREEPAQPGPISGLSTVSELTSGLIYSIDAVADADTYTWDVPAGWSIQSGQGTVSISVTSGSAGQNGNITVYASNSCGISATTSLAVTAQLLDCPTSTSIAPTTFQDLCVGDPSSLLTATVTTSGGSGAPTIQYQWYYNASNSNNIGTATMLSGETSESYSPDNTVGAAGDRYYFCVGFAANNGCGQTVATQSLASDPVQVRVTPTPNTPGAITGQADTTPLTAGYIYSISAVPHATTYTWTVPATWIITNGQGTTAITVTSGNDGDNGNISVTAGNICGTSAASTLAVTCSIAANPPTITLGTIAQICQGTITVNLPYSATTDNPDQYSIDFDVAAESAGFVDVVDASLPASPIEITVPANAPKAIYYGTLSVKNSSTGYISTAYTIQIDVNAKPTVPTISGNATVPQNSLGFRYSASSTGATSYTWTPPTGITITSGQGTSQITVSTGPAPASGDITVVASNTCGDSDPGSKNVTISVATNHTLYNCSSCHITHNAPGMALTNADGNDTLCQTCHVSSGAASAKPLIVTDNGTSSHAWNVTAVNATKETNTPTNPAMAVRLDAGKIICSTCHDQHNSSAAAPHLRVDNSSDLLCKDCHSARNVGLYADSPSNNKGSHPVGITYDGNDSRFNSSPTNTQLIGSKVECSSCHGVHDVDGSLGLQTNGNLLRTTNNSALCKDCHTYSTHNGFDCLDCHKTHNTNKDNIYMINNTVNSKTVVFTAETGPNSFADGDGTYDGICEVCHTSTSYFRNDGNAPDQNHTAQGGPQNELNCTGCHPHSSNFSPSGGDCVTCHQDNTTYPYLTGNFQLTDNHVAHTIQYSYGCSTCHSGNNHNNGTIDVAFNATGLATRNGLDSNTPVFNVDKTCDNIYCHSNGRTSHRGQEADFGTNPWDPDTNPTGAFEWSSEIGPQAATYVTAPAWDTGTITACNTCHGGAGEMNDPYEITNGAAGPVTGTGDVPPFNSHTRGAHISNSQNLSGNGWSHVQCFWCHNANGGSDASPNLQGTYGTSLHVDGESYFRPLWVSNGGTMVNTITYSAEGSAGHCGNGKTCW